MKFNIIKRKLLIFCLLNMLAVNIGFSQNNALNNLTVQDSIQSNSSDEILTTPFGVFNLTQTTGTVFRVSGEELRKTIGDNLSEALRGRVPGLRIIRGDSNPGTTGNYSYRLNGSTANPEILIDGQIRGLEVDLRDVEEVIVLSDATFNSLVGNFGDNGIIYVVTRGGKLGKPTIEVDYHSTLSTITHLPKLLSAAEYATVINRASNNDGFGTVYSADAIEAYRNGSDPINFPNVDNHDTYLSRSTQSNYASLNVYGGQDNVAYSAFVGYSDWDGLENVGAQKKGRRLNFRTKINTKINDLLSVHVSAYGKFGENIIPVNGVASTFNAISNTPANAFPLKVGDTAYVVSNQFDANLLSELEIGGVRTDYDANLTFDLGLDFDLNKYVPGLKYSTYGMMRTFNSVILQTNSTPGLYTIENLADINGQDSLALKLYRNESLDLDVGRSSVGIQRNFSYGGNFNYMKDLNDATLNLNLNHLLYIEPNRFASQPDSRNLTFNLNGAFTLQNKYTLYANVNSSTSSKFIGDNRTRIFPTVGASWLISNEQFLQDNKAIDFLKFKASYGQVGTEYTASTFYYLNTWVGGGAGNDDVYFGGNGGAAQEHFGYNISNIANPDLNWIVYNQLFAGVQLSLFKKLRLDVNYFNIDINDQIIKGGPLFADALGSDVYLPQINFTERNSTGFNANIAYQNSDHPFKYHVSVNAGYSKVIGEKIAETPFPDAYRLQQGKAEDNFIGYVSDGLFTADNIDSALPQFGDVQIGDIKYVDQNGDNVIDSRDQRAVGNTTPRFNYGITIGFEYKGFNFDATGMGVGGYDRNLAQYAYYRHSGLGNYFGSVNSNLPNGNENPRLSTLTSINNYRNSDYWLVDGSYFRISNVELGYTLPKSLLGNGAFSGVKLFLRGNNLAVFSKLKDLDIEDPTAGISEYPMMRTIALGASLNF